MPRCERHLPNQGGPDPGRRDGVRVLIDPGEHWVSGEAARRYGATFLDQINRRGELPGGGVRP